MWQIINKNIAPITEIQREYWTTKTMARKYAMDYLLHLTLPLYIKLVDTI